MDRMEGLLAEIDRITEPEGMIDTCRDLRDSMLFYDREVLLAMFSGILEGMVITSSFLAVMEGPEALAAITERLLAILSRLPARLSLPNGPLDVQTLIERFLEVGGRTIFEEYPAVVGILQAYLEGREEEESLDRLLWRARQRLRDDPDEALGLIGRAGAQVLLGAELRSAWMKLGGPISPWLHALFAVRESIPTIPEFRLPLAPYAEEAARQKGHPSVVSLDSVRRLRRPTGGGSPDAVDALLLECFSGNEELSPQARDTAKHEARAIEPILLAVAAEEELWHPHAEGEGLAPVHAVRLLEGQKSLAAVDVLLDIIDSAEPEWPIFQEARLALTALAVKAGGRILDFASRANLDTAVYLAGILAKGRQDERVYTFLSHLLARTSWQEGKEEVVRSLARYGDSRAISLLEEELQSPAALGGEQVRMVREALQHLKRRRARQERPSTRSGNSRLGPR